MGGFLLRKAGAALVVLVLASMLVFLGVRAIPGDPAIALGAENRDPALLAAIRHKYLLDRPLPVQYVHWIWLALHGDLGADQRELPVAHTIVTRIPITLELALLSMLVAMLVGIPAGVIAAVRRGKPSDYAATTVALVGLSRAALLARPADDHLVRGRPALAAGERLRVDAPSAREPRAHGHAGDRARHGLSPPC